MNNGTIQKNRSRSGMTLVEIMVTIGIVSTVLLTLIVMFGQSVGTVHKSQTESVAIFIAENIHSRLMTDPEWPPGRTSSFPFQAGSE